MLLEDLGPAGSGSRVTGCSLEQAELAIHQIANFHATWWEKPQLEEISWLTDVDFDPVALSDAHNRWWPDFLRQAEHRLPDPIKEIGERLGQHRANIMRHLGTSPRTLLHGDYQLDNLFFGTPEGGLPFAVVDWQRMWRGRGVGDVAYFLGGNLHPQDRRAIEMDLLRDYHQILVDNSSGPHHQDSGESKIRESTAGGSRKPSSDGKACGCSSKHLCGLTAWNT